MLSTRSDVAVWNVSNCSSTLSSRDSANSSLSRPVAVTYTMRFMSSKLAITGLPSPRSIRCSSATAIASGPSGTQSAPSYRSRSSVAALWITCRAVAVRSWMITTSRHRARSRRSDLNSGLSSTAYAPTFHSTSSSDHAPMPRRTFLVRGTRGSGACSPCRSIAAKISRCSFARSITSGSGAVSTAMSRFSAKK